MATFTQPTTASPRRPRPRPPTPPPTRSRPRPRSPPPPTSSSRWHRLRTRLGFQKSYHLLLFLVLGLAGVLGQGLAHSPKLDYFGVFCRRAPPLARGLHAAPGECHYFRDGTVRERAAMMLHVYAVVPLCFLLVPQFVPAFRRGRRGGAAITTAGLMLHRVTGYAVLLLTGVAVAGGVAASPRSFGGELSWQALVLVLGAMVVGGLGMAMGGIWQSRVEQHRAWMLRTWAWVCLVFSFPPFSCGIFFAFTTHQNSDKTSY